jgi:hypothetical protein
MAASARAGEPAQFRHTQAVGAAALPTNRPPQATAAALTGRILPQHIPGVCIGAPHGGSTRLLARHRQQQHQIVSRAARALCSMPMPAASKWKCKCIAERVCGGVAAGSGCLVQFLAVARPSATADGRARGLRVATHTEGSLLVHVCGHQLPAVTGTATATAHACTRTYVVAHPPTRTTAHCPLYHQRTAASRTL